MRMFNADGSEAEMCGNGVRCVAKLVHDHGISANNPLRIETGRGVLTLHLTVKGGKAEWVRVDMGEPILEAERIPTTFSGPRVVDVPSPLPGLTMTCVSMGNPHAVLYVEDAAKVPLEAWGPMLETHALFPRKINVHFVQVVSKGEAVMRTWERGSGVTLACGTGACAVCVAGVLSGRTGRELLAHLPGGNLRLGWDEATNHVFMTGPATEVFTGEWGG
jgi:diaminopimelate epimerase